MFCWLLFYAKFDCIYVQSFVPSVSCEFLFVKVVCERESVCECVSVCVCVCEESKQIED